MKIWIINGPNLNLLGRREPEIYGSQTFEEYFEELREQFSDDELLYFQSNHEGFLIDKLHEIGFDAHGIVLNAGGLTHTSVALRDAISAIESPVVEVHISDIYAREDFRKINFLKEKCVKSIVGKGLHGYFLAVKFLINR
jgi:3-dehydroquinate dehydratase II